ncbi:wax ester/triacylglycerol synthase domain-containing protein [Streptomyces xanthochromogenes]|uniref:wax ester/triacylglycerol synthase domain-containing protein n=1 Tax=Streptomyces xanthochromogenes TaxID=67384 RepID=UPI003441F922
MTQHIGLGEHSTVHVAQRRTEPADSMREFTSIQDRGMLEWARRRPDDGFVIGVALRLRGAKPTPERLADLVTTRLPRLPALAECLRGPDREEYWRPDGGFQAARHVYRLEAQGDRPPLLEAITNQPVWEDRPRWGLWLMDGEHPDEYWLAYRVHHAAQDGAAAAHTVRRLFDARTPLPASPERDRGADGDWAAAPDPVDGRLLATAEVSAEAVRAVSRASGASLNDVYLTALAGALRAWLPAPDRGLPVPVRVPFNVRLRGERADRGNRFGYARLLLPVEEPSAAKRLKAVVEQTRLWPRDRNRRLLDALPDAMLLPHIATFLSPQDALATVTMLQIPGPLALDGSPVTGGVALPPLVSGYLFSSVLFLHGTRATVSFTAEKGHEHVRDLPRLWVRELTALAHATPA